MEPNVAILLMTAGISTVRPAISVTVNDEAGVTVSVTVLVLVTVFVLVILDVMVSVTVETFETVLVLTCVAVLVEVTVDVIVSGLHPPNTPSKMAAPDPAIKSLLDSFIDLSFCSFCI
jgi:hypothetical protein